MSVVDSAYKNKIINGNFDIWQRGTSNGMSGYYTADRWRSENVGTTKVASQQAFTLGQTAVPGEPTYFMRHVVTSSAGAGNYCFLQQKMESMRTLAGKTATLSFWAKADSSKNIAVEFGQNFGTGGSPSTFNTANVTTCALTSSWQKFFVTTSITSISGKTLGSNNNDFFELDFWFDAGSTWNSRTNSLGQQSGTFDIAQVQVEEGPVATAFEQRHIGQELALCQRYYQTYSTQTFRIDGYASAAAQSVNISSSFRVEMRGTPTATTPYQTNTNITNGPFITCNRSGFYTGGQTGAGGVYSMILGVCTFDVEL
jgi:hypothetical protein